jgi:hypothetical protein
VHLGLWDRHYRAELPVRGVSFDCEQIEKPLSGLLAFIFLLSSLVA